MTHYQGTKEMKSDGTGWYVYDTDGMVILDVTTDENGVWTSLKQWNQARKEYEMRYPGEKDIIPGLYDD